MRQLDSIRISEKSHKEASLLQSSETTEYEDVLDGFSAPTYAQSHKLCTLSSSSAIINTKWPVIMYLKEIAFIYAFPRPRTCP